MDDWFSCLKALSDPTRLSIVEILLHHDLCAGAVARRLGISESAVSQHIKVLKEVGLVDGVKCGYFMHYAVNRDMLIRLSEAFASMSGIERHPCDPSAEGCTAKRPDSCPAEKGVGRCPKVGTGEPFCRGCRVVMDPTLDR